MSYIGGYRTRGMAALGDMVTMYEVTVGDFGTQGKRLVQIYKNVVDGEAARDAELSKLARLYDNKGKKPGQGARYIFKYKKAGVKTVAHVAQNPLVALLVGAPMLRPGVRTPAPSGPPPGSDAGGGGVVYTGPADNSGGGGGSQEVETDNAVATPQGPVAATANGQPLVATPTGFPTTTALLVGGGLLAAYLLFGRKRA